MYFSHQYLSIDPKRFITPTLKPTQKTAVLSTPILTPTNRLSLWSPQKKS